MFRYVLAILLVTCYNSSGNPVRTVPKQISTSIIALENNCGNVFLKSLLNSKINECSDVVPPYKTKQLQCLMFYDMGTQLCAAVNASGITLNEDYTTKIIEETDVTSLCETAKDWIFNDFLEYHSYKTIIEKIFKHPVPCGKICGSDELMTDANFYCKFYKWGWEVIKNQVNTVSKDGTNVSAVAESQPDTASNPNKPVISSNETLDIPIKNTTSNDLQKETQLSSGSSIKTSEQNADAKQIVSEAAMTNNEANAQIVANAIKKNEQGILPGKEDIKKSENPSNLPQNIAKEVKEVENKNMSTVPLSGTGKEEIKLNPEEKEVVLDNPKDKVEVKESALENPKDKVLIDSEHYGDDDFNSEDGKEGNEDLQGEDDGGDPMINDNVKPLEKKTETISKIESVDSTFNKEISQREFYSGNAQDIGPDDDDDHFFTFFLTAIVLVVLLYILYHDKSKISKLFFGLLVEGRQGGRRRNSRGHAYRRLDTLEQAMSTNTTAPPSKIIY